MVLEHETAYFESHFIEDVKLPLIFHTDVKRPGMEFVNWHENIEVLLVLEGEGYVTTTFSTKPLRPGDIYIVNANITHFAASHSFVRYHCLIIDRDFCVRNNLDTNLLWFQNLIQDAQAARLYTSLVEECKRPKGKLYYPRVRMALLAFLLYLCEHFAEERRKDEAAHASKINVDLAVGYINSHFSQPLCLDELARVSCISKYHFARKFKQHTGCTVVTYINQVRCEHAKMLLTQSDDTIKQIAYACGFEYQSYFTKIFRRIHGLSPTEYRQDSRAQK